MKLQSMPLRRVGLAAICLLGSAAGWALVPLVLFGRIERTYRDVALSLPASLLLGLIVGAATGLGQVLACRLHGPAAWRWLRASLAGYGLAIPGGIIIGLLIVSFTYGLHSGAFVFLPLTEPGSVTYWSFPAAPVYGGFLAGLCQLVALRGLIDRPTRAMSALWVLGAWAGIGLGLFAGGEIAAQLLPGGAALGTTADAFFKLVWGGAWGATAGLISASLLWILQRETAKMKRLANGVKPIYR